MDHQFLAEHYHGVQFVLDNIILRIVQTLPLRLTDMSREFQAVFTITNICIITAALQCVEIDT